MADILGSIESPLLTSELIRGTLNFYNQGVTIPTPAFDVTNPSVGAQAGPATFNLNEHVFLIDFTEPAFTTTTGSPVVASVGDTTKNNGYFIQKITVSQARFRHYAESGNVATLQFDPFATCWPNGRHVVAICRRSDGTTTYAANGFITCFKTSTTAPTSFDDGIASGRYGNATPSNTYGGTVNRLAWWNVGMSDDQLCELTRNFSILSAKSQTFIPSFGELGQSNSSGRGTGAQTYANLAKMNALFNSGTYGGYSDPADAVTSALIAALTDTGPGVNSSGHMMNAMISDKPSLAGLATFNANLQTTDWATLWGPQIRVASVGVTADCLHLGATMLAALNQICIAAQQMNVNGINWHVGERDAQLGTSETIVKTQFGLAIQYVNRLLNNQRLPHVLTTMHKWDATLGITEVNWNNMTQWIKDIGGSTPNCLPNDISDQNGTGGDWIHIPSAGQAVKGQRAQALFKILGAY